MCNAVDVAGDPEKYSLCDSLDQDPKNNCAPVNCLIKYNGFRSFFNRTLEKCQKSPLCYDPKTLVVAEEEKPKLVRLLSLFNFLV